MPWRKRSVTFQQDVHDGLEALAERLNKGNDGPRISVNHLVNKACRRLVKDWKKKPE